ncbi:trans-2-enoyl-CoA reductase [Seminavis robusta]|uniref:Trans-2-enoyl-CoA reductase n=1 Tax=Seminavis robusta TaxID=568900 RepID=A0A9N8F1Q2_9STRA|nr:trans-2-enoyl-CoA reductase [Seminavis robusta]|eukprot:Sro2314_g322890.1 trans-2-enoyl-CoA reductase (245) ;mRNA; f:1744-2478
MADPSLPTTHRVWRMKSEVKDTKDAKSIEESLSLEEEQVPTIKEGQILVQVACCTINHEDVLHLENAYVNTKDIPIPRGVGFEGSGKVVASKASFYLGLKVGSRVAFYSDQSCALAEYLVCDALTVTPIPAGVSYSTAAAAVTNAFSVLLMVQNLKKGGHKAVVNTVGAGSLGRLFTKHAKSLGINVIALVRRDAQKELCQADGAKVVLNLSDPDFDQQLSQAIQETNCHFAYDGLAGDMPDRF